MAFASAWLQKGAVFPQMVREAPNPGTEIIIVIPAFDEAGIIRLLDSLAACDPPECQSEVIVGVNAPANATQEGLINNMHAIRNLQAWEKENPNCFFRLYFFDLGQPSLKNWGVGLARKSLMDEALRRFDSVEKPGGIIVNIDADCVVDTNYFTALENDFLLIPGRKACSVFFEHPVKGDEFPGEVYSNVVLYELHLRYYQNALRYTGFPYTFHTVGSSIAVRALTYMLAGGMNRRQAGEDFYFVQKLMPAGGYFNLNTTTVYPSPRPSERVPFGTGMTIAKMLEGGAKSYFTYNPGAFSDLKEVFSMAGRAFKSGEKAITGLYYELPATIREFMDSDEWTFKISEVSRNTSGIESFRKRFFEWFNMFKVVKYLNHSHISAFRKIPVEDAAIELLAAAGAINIPGTPLELLLLFRKIGREF